jgi:hypothetical protein
MSRRVTVLIIGAVIAIPLIFASLGASQDAGLAFGVLLVIVGIGWSLVGSRRDG